MKKTASILLLVTLLLLTAVLVGMATAAGAEEADCEAILYRSGAEVDRGTFADMVFKAGQNYDGYNARIVLCKDIELKAAALDVKSGHISEIDGQNHTIYIDESVNTSATTRFMSISKTYSIVFKNINFVGQDMDWKVGDEMKTFGAAGWENAAIVVNPNLHFEMINCSMKYFSTNNYTSCIRSPGYTAEHNDDWGIWLTDTVITNNYAHSGVSQTTANAVSLHASGYVAGRIGSYLHVLGNTIIMDNYGKDGYQSNVCLGKSGTSDGTHYDHSSVLVVEEDFTGKVLLVKGSSGNLGYETARRGSVFYVGNSFDGEDNTGNKIRTGLVYGMFWSQFSTPKSGALVELYEGSKYTGTWGDAGAPTASGVIVTTDDGVCSEVNKFATAINDVTYHNVRCVDVFKSVKVTHSSSANKDGNPLPVAADATWTIDFHGNTYTRGSGIPHIKMDGSGVNVTIKNAKFTDSDLIAAGTGGYASPFVLTGGATLTLENCTFTDMLQPTAAATYLSRGAVATLTSSTLYLKDVQITNSNGTNGAIACQSGNGTKIYVAGNTRIFNDEDDTANVIHLYTGNSSLGVCGDFTGHVELSIAGIGPNKAVIHNGTTVTDEYIREACAVAEGAEIHGRIFYGEDYFAYNDNGILRWTKANEPLSTNHIGAVTIDPNDKTKLTGDSWFYNDGTKDVQTTVAVPNVYNYFIKETNIDADAYIKKSDGSIVYGTFANMLTNAAAGETVEVMRDLKNLQNLTISAACTVDGNGKTLSVYIGDEQPTLDGKYWYMIKSIPSGVTLKNLVIWGGAAEAGVWDGPLSPENLSLINVTGGQTLTMERCLVTGLRLKVNDQFGSSGLIIKHCSLGVLNLIDCEFTDNMVEIPYASGENEVYKKTALWFRVYSSGNMNLSGEVIIKDNWSITNDALKAIPANLTDVVTARLHVGQLTNGSQIEMENSVSYTPILDNAGKPYDNTDYFYAYDPETMYLLADHADGLTGVAAHTGGDLAYDGTTVTLLGGPTVTFKARQAGIDRDKVNFTLITQANVGYFTDKYDIVVKFGGTEVARETLNLYTLKGTEISIPVDVGMAELADEIVVEFQDRAMQKVISTSASDSVKAYATTVINMTNEDIVTNGFAPSAEKATSMKAALASLLQYGAMVQKHFKYNLEALAMTADEESAWTTAGYIQAVGDGLRGGKQNEAMMSGSVSGVNIVGATLTMENQMSLRLYFTADSLDGITFTVGGQTAEVQTGNGMYYLEALHIGTASLASPVIITITKGSETLTYTVSPMSYVYAVFAKNNAAVTDSLRNACEALYYYFAAAGDHFGNFETNIGFETDVVMSASTTEDPVNTYGLPYGIA